jgi:cobalt-precorrin 5A hydrolase
MNIGIIAFTAAGFELASRLSGKLRLSGHTASPFRCGKNSLRTWTSEHFASDDALVFVGAAGIAVRAVAPLVHSKVSDPAVIVIDEHGKFAIPILSGHIGGANRLAQDISKMISCIPVVTTATDCNNVFAVDTWASENNVLIANPEKIKWVSAHLLAGECVYVKSFFPIAGNLPEGLVVTEDEYDVILTVRSRGRKDALRLVPLILTLGVGCQRGVTSGELDAAFELILKKGSCLEEAVCRVCSIDMKSDERGILEFCSRHKLPFQTFTAEALAAVSGRFASSEFVKKTTGVDNVCERSAVLGSGGQLYVKKNAGNGITMALGIAPYTVRFMEE